MIQIRTFLRWLSSASIFLLGGIYGLVSAVLLLSPLVLYLSPSTPLDAFAILTAGKPPMHDLHSLMRDYKFLYLFIVIAGIPLTISYIMYRKRAYGISLTISIAYLMALLLRPWRKY